MAEVLIKAVNAETRNQEKDRRGYYKRGDPVVVMPDGHSWRRLERVPKFWQVRLPGVYQRCAAGSSCNRF